MNKCRKCGNTNYSTIAIHTETTFGHGDSTHKCYVKCKCGNKSDEFSNWGLFSDKAFREAQANWNEQNP
jgi:hypothetical protein